MQCSQSDHKVMVQSGDGERNLCGGLDLASESGETLCAAPGLGLDSVVSRAPQLTFREEADFLATSVRRTEP